MRNSNLLLLVHPFYYGIKDSKYTKNMTELIKSHKGAIWALDSRKRLENLLRIKDTIRPFTTPPNDPYPEGLVRGYKKLARLIKKEHGISKRLFSDLFPGPDINIDVAGGKLYEFDGELKGCLGHIITQLSYYNINSNIKLSFENEREYVQ